MPKTMLGIDENIEALLAYTGFFITGMIFLVIEKENKFVRFHALQSTIVFLGFFGVHILLTPILYIPIIRYPVYLFLYFLNILALITWLLCMYKAYQNQLFKLPIVGNIAEKSI